MGVKLEKIVKTYYDNLAAGKITARKCQDCGAVEWRPEMEDIKPYCLAIVELEEGPIVNVMVRGVNRKNRNIVAEQMPVDVHATIIPKEGYDTVIFDLDNVPDVPKKK